MLGTPGVVKFELVKFELVLWGLPEAFRRDVLVLETLRGDVGGVRLRRCRPTRSVCVCMYVCMYVCMKVVFM